MRGVGTSTDSLTAGPADEPDRGGLDRRVLVVDDSAPIRELLAVNLELEGFEVRCAADGRAGLELARAWRPDVVTLDVVMPDLDGLAVLTELRADGATCAIPVLMLTGRAQPADRDRAEALGADGYLAKPFEPAELVAAVLDLARNGRR